MGVRFTALRSGAVKWVTIHKATPCTLSSRQISGAFQGNCCVGAWVLFPNRAPGIRRLGRFLEIRLTSKLREAGKTPTPPHAGVTPTSDSPYSLVHTMWKFSNAGK